MSLFFEKGWIMTQLGLPWHLQKNLITFCIIVISQLLLATKLSLSNKGQYILPNRTPLQKTKSRRFCISNQIHLCENQERAEWNFTEFLTRLRASFLLRCFIFLIYLSQIDNSFISVNSEPYKTQSSLACLRAEAELQKRSEWSSRPFGFLPSF